MEGLKFRTTEYIYMTQVVREFRMGECVWNIVEGMPYFAEEWSVYS
jgi:hypothetical protein